MGTSLRPFLERREEPGKEVVLGGVSPHYATDGGRNPARDLMAIYRDDEPWAMLDKTFEVARQVREYPDGVLGQCELENWRYVTLDKSVATVGEISRSPRKTPASPSGIRVSGPGVSR